MLPSSPPLRLRSATASLILIAAMLAASSAGAAQDRATAASTQSPVTPAAVPEQPGTDRAPHPVYAWPTTLDRAGRILVAVEVNGKGPFRFVLDTGANRSAIAHDLASELGLEPSSGRPLLVHGVTGSAQLNSVEVSDFRVGDVHLRRLRMPVLPPAVLSGADGILGVTELGRTRIEIDFRQDTVTVHKSGGGVRMPGDLAVPVSLRHRGLLSAQARLGRVRATAVIDTGAERSLGNRALWRALQLRQPREPVTREATVIGATPQVSTGTSFLSPPIRIGEAELDDLEITFGDLHVFRIWGLENQPALVVGMDLLGTVERLVVDYRQREILLKP